MTTLEERVARLEGLASARAESGLDAKFTLMIALQSATLTLAIVWLVSVYFR